MSEKRRDNKGRGLRTGESQRPDGRYAFKYTDQVGKVRFLYSWRLEPGDPIPRGKQDKPALRDLEREIRRDLEDGIMPQGGGMTVAALVKKYLSQKRDLRQQTKHNYLNTLKLLESTPFGQKRIDQVKPSDAKAWFLSLREKGRKFNTIHNYQTVLRPTFQMAMEDDLIRKNPFAFRISTVLTNDSTPRFALTADQEMAFLDYILETKRFRKYYDGIYILLHTGLRISELTGLTRKDLDFSAGVIHVRRQLCYTENGTYTIVEPKTKSGTRDVPMSPQVKTALRRILASHPKAIEPVVDGVGGFLFLRKHSQPMASKDWQVAFKNIIKSYNETHPEPLLLITPHICRHTFATNMAKAGMAPKALQFIMGHSSIKVTMDVYTHLEVTDIVREFQKVSGAE